MTITISEKSKSTLIDTTILETMELREAGLVSDGPYSVIQSTIISAEEHEDLYKAIIQVEGGGTVAVFFRWIHTWDEVYIFGDEGESIAPKVVYPKTKTITTVIYE